MIRFLAPWRGYQPTDTATLEPSAEERLVAIGTAELYTPPPPPVDEPAPSPRRAKSTRKDAKR